MQVSQYLSAKFARQDFRSNCCCSGRKVQTGDAELVDLIIILAVWVDLDSLVDVVMLQQGQQSEVQSRMQMKGRREHHALSFNGQLYVFNLTPSRLVYWQILLGDNRGGQQLRLRQTVAYGHADQGRFGK